MIAWWWISVHQTFEMGVVTFNSCKKLERSGGRYELAASNTEGSIEKERGTREWASEVPRVLDFKIEVNCFAVA